MSWLVSYWSQNSYKVLKVSCELLKRFVNMHFIGRVEVVMAERVTSGVFLK